MDLLNDILKQVVEEFLNMVGSFPVEFGDIRALELDNEWVWVRDERVEKVQRSSEKGFGIRVLVDGKWGFSSSFVLSPDEVKKCLREAYEIARYSRKVDKTKISIAPEPPHKASFKTPVKINPFDVPLERKVSLLMDINRILKSASLIQRADAHLRFRRRHQWYGSTEGSLIETDIITSSARYTAWAVDKGDMEFRSFPEDAGNAGWEFIEELKLVENAERVREEAIEKLRAPLPEEGEMELILDPHNLCLTIHESVGHATELDRVLGYEANFAGTSFLKPEMRGSFKYGSEWVNFVADNTMEGGLATTGFDDEGVECQRWYIVKEGVFLDFSSSREAAGMLGEERSKGSGRAMSFYSFPINRIPNLFLEPGREDVTPEDLIADTKHGILIEGMGSFSIDQRRLNFQFGGDAFYEIRNGKKIRMLRKFLYQSITPEFWGSVVGLTGKRHWRMYGIMGCGKGEPMQTAQMSHGAPWVKFKKIRIVRG